MVTFFIIYGAIALIVCGLFMSPVFSDWGDYSAKDIRGCMAFSVVVGLLWPLVAILLAVMVCCGAYYSRKDDQNCSDDED